MPQTIHVKLPKTPSWGPTLCDTKDSMRGASQVCMRWPGAKEYAKRKARIEENGDKMCETCDERTEELAHDETKDAGGEATDPEVPPTLPSSS